MRTAGSQLERSPCHRSLQEPPVSEFVVELDPPVEVVTPLLAVELGPVLVPAVVGSEVDDVDDVDNVAEVDETDDVELSRVVAVVV